LLVGNTVSVGTCIAFSLSRSQQYHFEGIVIRLDRRGFNLVEVLVVIVLIGVVIGFATPTLTRIGNGANLRGARGALITAVNVAKSSAVTTGKCSYLKLNNNAVTVFLTACSGGSQTEVISNRNFGTDYSVAVTMQKGTGTALTVDSLGFDPRGIPVDHSQTTTFTITKSGESKTLVVGAYGKVAW
jgi:prepilin-type N-terminal cleavage/methylation domain-containing protein